MADQAVIISQLLYYITTLYPLPPEESPAPHLSHEQVCDRLVEIITKPATRRTADDFAFVMANFTLEWSEWLIRNSRLTVEQIKLFARGTRTHPTPEDVRDLIQLVVGDQTGEVRQDEIEPAFTA